MSQVKTGDTVKVHYTGRLEDGSVFDSSVERDPIQFTIGGRRLIPGFEKALIGMEPGQSRTVNLAPEEAYGPYRQDRVMEVDRREITPNIDLRIGQRLEMQQPGQQNLILTVTRIQDMQVTLDANHELAGKNLTFEIELVSIE